MDFKTLAGVIFHGFGLPWGPLGVPLGRPFRDLSPSRSRQDPKIDAFLGDPFSNAFFRCLSMDFRGVLGAKTMDFV